LRVSAGLSPDFPDREHRAALPKGRAVTKMSGGRLRDRDCTAPFGGLAHSDQDAHLRGPWFLEGLAPARRRIGSDPPVMPAGGWWASWLAVDVRLLTVAGQRRTCTGFPCSQSPASHTGHPGPASPLRR